MASRTGGAGRGCENDLRGEERTPLAGGGVMFCRAADKFVMAGDMFHEPGGAEPRDSGGLKIEGDEWEPGCSLHFHASIDMRFVCNP